MANEQVQQIVVRAVQKAYDEWAGEHPLLAAVIDRITLTQQAVESLRQSQEYRQAVENYQRSSAELELLGSLIELAKPVIAAMLAG